MSKSDASVVFPCARFATDKIIGKYIIFFNHKPQLESRNVAKGMAAFDYYLEYISQLHTL